MGQIFVIKDAGGFTANPLLRKYSGRIKDSACIVLSSFDGREILKSSGIIEEVSYSSYSDEERTAFIRDYTALIASLDSSYKESLLWWSTDLSSKNRYLCPLPDLIQELLEIEAALQGHAGKPLLIITQSLGIYGALRKLAAKYGRGLLWDQAVPKAFLQRTGGALKSFINLFLNAARFYVRALWARLALGQYARQGLSPMKEYYVVKTFSYRSSWDDKGEYADSFFGSLPRILSKDHQVLVLSYHWLGYREFIKRIAHEKTLTILPVEYFLKGGDILRAVLRILTFRLALPAVMNFRGLDVSDILRFELARTMNGIQVYQLLHYDLTRHMLKKLRTGTFLFTFENNPWERMCMLACRHHSPLTKVIGCQHSVVPQAALNMFVHPIEKNMVPLPDRILTTGEIPKNILQCYGDYGLVPVESACALRYEYLFRVKPIPRQRSRGHILLVLDGVVQTQQMLKFVLEQLGGNDHYKLRIRCHPAMPWGLLSGKFHFDISKYAKVEISKGTLQEDLGWSDMIIYWQTAVVLEAISMGKPAINFKSHEILSFDPLFKLDALKWTVNPREDLLKVIAAVEHMDDQAYQKQLKEATVYIQQYFHAVTPETLQLFEIDLP